MDVAKSVVGFIYPVLLRNRHLLRNRAAQSQVSAGLPISQMRFRHLLQTTKKKTREAEQGSPAGHPGPHRPHSFLPTKALSLLGLFIIKGVTQINKVQVASFVSGTNTAPLWPPISQQCPPLTALAGVPGHVWVRATTRAGPRTYFNVYLLPIKTTSTKIRMCLFKCQFH